MSMLRSRLTLALAVTLSALTMVIGPAATAAQAAQPQVSLTAIENDVMCVACHESLAVAQSPEAFSERQYIRTLILQGESKKQIEHNLVEQYGPSVLALPPAHGFNLLVYVVPPVLLILGLATVAITIPRWRRRTRATPDAPMAAGGSLDPAESNRLDEDLARHL
jgi:cytochrome c-type biogenesis protein CcmH